MQQNNLNCQQMVKAIRNSIRREIEESGFTVHPGFIKVSIVPCTDEADEFIGGYSDGCDDFANYEYTYALKPEYGIDVNGTSSYVDVAIKKRTLISGESANDAAGCVYAWNDFLEIMVRVSGASDKNGFLASIAYDALVPFFESLSPDYSVRVNK